MSGAESPGVTLQGTLMNHTNVKRAIKAHVDEYLAILSSDQSAPPPIFGEHNSLYNQGRPGLSNAFGAALWGLDFNLYAASQGFKRVHMHQGTDYRVRSSLSPFIDSPLEHEQGLTQTVRLLAAHRHSQHHARHQGPVLRQHCARRVTRRLRPPSCYSHTYPPGRKHFPAGICLCNPCQQRHRTGRHSGPEHALVQYHRQRHWHHTGSQPPSARRPPLHV